MPQLINVVNVWLAWQDWSVMCIASSSLPSGISRR